MIIYDNITIDKTVKTFKYQYLRIINRPLLRSFIFLQGLHFFSTNSRFRWDQIQLLWELTANRTYLF